MISHDHYLPLWWRERCVFAVFRSPLCSHERFEVGYLSSFHKWGSNQVSSFPPGVSKDKKNKDNLQVVLKWKL